MYSSSSTRPGSAAEKSRLRVKALGGLQIGTWGVRMEAESCAPDLREAESRGTVPGRQRVRAWQRGRPEERSVVALWLSIYHSGGQQLNLLEGDGQLDLHTTARQGREKQ